MPIGQLPRDEVYLATGLGSAALVHAEDVAARGVGQTTGEAKTVAGNRWQNRLRRQDSNGQFMGGSRFESAIVCATSLRRPTL